MIDALDALMAVFAFAVLLIMVVPIAMFVGVDAARGESQYAGQVVDVEVDRGYVFQTTQALVKTDRRSSTTETFCVHPSNREQIQTLKSALNEGDRVRITYSRPLFVPVWTCEPGTSIIRDVEVIEEGNATST